MSFVEPVVVRTLPGPALRAARWVAWLFPLALLGALIAFVLTGHPPPSLRLIVAGGIALIGLLALTLTRFDSAVFLGFMLMSIVPFQPGPPDMVFLVVLAVAVATGRFHLQRLPLSVGALVAAFVFLNILSATFVVDVPTAERYFAITLYLAAFSVWLAGYGDSTERARRVLLGLLITGVVTATAACLALYLPGIPLTNRMTGAQRAQGLFHDPNIFGPYMLMLALVAISLSIVAVAGGVVVATGSADFLLVRARPQTYDTERFSAQESGLHLVAAYPFGIGPGQFESYVPVSAHSTYIRALAEQGVLGLVTILALILTTLVLAGRNAVIGRDTYGIGSAALLGAWCGLLANSAFIDTLHWRHLWLVAGLIWAGTMLGDRARRR